MLLKQYELRPMHDPGHLERSRSLIDLTGSSDLRSVLDYVVEHLLHLNKLQLL